MRNVFLIATAMMLASVSLQAAQRGQQQQMASQQTAPGGLSCFEGLAAPEYTRAALQAHIEGSVWTTTHVNAQGSIDKIDTRVVSAWDSAPKFQVAPAEKVIRAAKIRPECAGKPVLVVFRYELHGDPTATPETTSRMDPPNVAWIDSQAMPAALK